MRITLKFKIAEIDGKKSLYDLDGREVTIESIAGLFKTIPDDPGFIPAIMNIDDGRELDLKPFSLDMARAILDGKIKDTFISLGNGLAVTVSTLSAKGDYPIMGLDPDGYPCLWDAEGNARDGADDRRLMLASERPSAGAVPEKKPDGEATVPQSAVVQKKEPAGNDRVEVVSEQTRLIVGDGNNPIEDLIGGGE